ncbi:MULTISPECIES: hypothetical protein [unclassified Corynebacterium]|uniref:hypothetical protein n=1 Tax=unclassified Corynebacterium TaxID=2624378 RepID=UPI0029CA8249|nr:MULTISPECIES: hypothetical protein [unclassified Corynebacterium]WPF66969.1 hypothetical protein OLX12_04385 [Corynebacterium sp. 22KM0430]WPF69457.1 hypothetical protein OLW90_04380 [Corynebacterium sp. 21KM1197]
MRSSKGLLAATAVLMIAASPVGATEGFVRIDDPGYRLDADDTQRLEAETPGLGLPESVTQVNYVVVDHLGSSFNDAFLDWIGEHRPDLVPQGTGEGKTWAPGSLIVSADMADRNMGIYCADQVCEDLHLNEESHRESALSAMQPALRKDDIAQGFLDGLHAATAQPEDEDFPWTILGALAGGGAGLGALLLGIFRRRNAQTARTRYEELRSEYAHLALTVPRSTEELRGLRSPLASEDLRERWDSLSTRFSALPQEMDSWGLTPDSPNKQFRRHSKDIGRAHALMGSLRLAGQQITLLAKIERGDATAREAEAIRLEKDIESALDHAKSSRVQDLAHRAAELRSDLSAEDFPDRYAALLRDYAEAIRDIRDTDFAETSDTHRVPRLGDSDWRPGYGVHSFVPFMLVHSWYLSDTSDSSGGSGSTSAVNTTFSSGFAGGGGSSSF